MRRVQPHGPTRGFDHRHPSFGLQIKSTIRTDNDAADVDDLFYVQTREGEPVPSTNTTLVRHVERAPAFPLGGRHPPGRQDAGFIGHAAHG